MRPRSACCCPGAPTAGHGDGILHDQTADRIVDIVSQLSHVNATIVPFNVAPGLEEHREVATILGAPQPTRPKADDGSPPRSKSPRC